MLSRAQIYYRANKQMFADYNKKYFTKAENRKKRKVTMRKWLKKHPGYTWSLYDNRPWVKTYKYIYNRIHDGKHPTYSKIKRLISKNELKELWFRDKAYMMEKPSIDRINEKDNYTFDNCRYIELSINIKRKAQNGKSNE